MAYNIMWYHIRSYHNVLFHFHVSLCHFVAWVTYHVVSFYILSHHIISYKNVIFLVPWYCFVSPWPSLIMFCCFHMMQYRTGWYHFVLFYCMWYHVMLSHIIFCCFITYHDTSCHIDLYLIVLSHVMSCHVMSLSSNILCCVTFYFFIT